MILDRDAHYTLKEFGALCGKTGDAILHYVKWGRLDAIKFEGKWYIPKTEVKKLPLVPKKELK